MSNLDLYKKYQSQLKTGDHIGWSGTGIISKLIQFFSKGELNHSSLAIRMNYQGLHDRRFVLEALASGIEFHLLSEKLKII